MTNSTPNSPSVSSIDATISSTATKVGSKLKKIGLWTLAVLVVFLGFYIYWKYYFTYSDGFRSGLLQKVSHRGNVFKTYEGELVMSSIIAKTNVPIASEKFIFSVTDETIADQMQKAEGKYVRLHYKQKNATLPWRGDSEYIVDKIELEKGQ
jgi:molybdopterin-binding protein